MDRVARREQAIHLFNQTWTLLEKADRTADEDFLMIHTAHASLFHWLQVGTPLNEARGLWLISRAFALIGNKDEVKKFLAMGTDAAKGIQKTEDSEYFLKELASIDIDKT